MFFGFGKRMSSCDQDHITPAAKLTNSRTYCWQCSVVKPLATLLVVLWKKIVGDLTASLPVDLPERRAFILSIGCRGRSNIVNQDSPSMLCKWPVFQEKTRFFAENAEGFPPEKETSFAELLRCRACWLGSMVAIRTQPQDVGRCRMLMPRRGGVRELRWVELPPLSNSADLR